MFGLKNSPNLTVLFFASFLPHRHQADRLRFAILASPSSLHRLHLAVFTSPHRLRFAFFKLIVFASPSSPRRLRLAVFASPSSTRRLRLAVFDSSSSIAPVFVSSLSSWKLACRDRRRCSASWLITHGVGQSPCALGRRRQCTSRDFPLSMRWWSTWGVHSRKGLHRQVSPDLSSDKSPFHRIPLKRCVVTVGEQPTGCNGLAANGQQVLNAELRFSIQILHIDSHYPATANSNIPNIKMK
ncbi:hypothetical protein OUZ56_019355 [Daphnia magna]|uniref:Uncharacterized protein n=1 Tax=Daphnia magna TaxID=35525 RepID=A0ABQ9ZBB9_9CRUS|nr:hypothetical protein OUZ56_019355 [Daphnia magna]